LFQKNNIQIHYEKIISNKSLIILLLLFITGLYFWHTNIYIYVSYFSLYDKVLFQQLYYNIFRFLIGLIGSLLVILIAVKVLKNNRNNFIEKSFSLLGIDSLGIYIISTYFFMTVTNLRKDGEFNYFYTILISIIVLICSIILTELI
jgi:hypothetical protein